MRKLYLIAGLPVVALMMCVSIQSCVQSEDQQAEQSVALTEIDLLASSPEFQNYVDFADQHATVIAKSYKKLSATDKQKFNDLMAEYKNDPSDDRMTELSKILLYNIKSGADFADQLRAKVDFPEGMTEQDMIRAIALYHNKKGTSRTRSMWPGEGTPNDIDGDGKPNDQDDDMDGDGNPNDWDWDIDGDGIDNDWDDDMDGDGKDNWEDNDIDGDGWDNDWDNDDDGDFNPDDWDDDDNGDGWVDNDNNHNGYDDDTEDMDHNGYPDKDNDNNGFEDTDNNGDGIKDKDQDYDRNGKPDWDNNGDKIPDNQQDGDRNGYPDWDNDGNGKDDKDNNGNFIPDKEERLQACSESCVDRYLSSFMTDYDLLQFGICLDNCNKAYMAEP